jgi:muramoyltetrapeptide carboxypeptidase
MERRLFVRSLATAAGAGLVAGCGTSHDDPGPEPTATAVLAYTPALVSSRASSPRRAAFTSRRIRKPRRLQKGDTIGLVAPAGPLRHAEDLEHAKRLAAMLGLKMKLGDHIRARYGYLAGSDADRAKDFNEFVHDPRVRAIFFLRGGYGTMRILDAIDYDALKADPKVILGFSDVTVLLNAITTITGVVTFHGPVAGHPMPERAVAGIRRAVMSAEPLGEFRVPEIGPLAGGAASGQLVGGNLSMVAALSGTPYAVPCAGKILMLEDVKEAPYRVDRMLTQLRLSGDLDAVAGIALGRFQDCLPRADDDKPSLTIEETLGDRLASMKKPMITNIGIGHMESQWTLPIGMNVSIDGNAGTLVIAEPAVS